MKSIIKYLLRYIILIFICTIVDSLHPDDIIVHTFPTTTEFVVSHRPLVQVRIMEAYKTPGRVIRRCKNENDVISHLSRLVEYDAELAMRRKGVFNIAVSGGSMPKQLTKCLSVIPLDLSKFKIFFCDERVVPFDNDYSTYGEYIKEFKGKLPIQEDQFVPINPNLPAEEAAKDYAKKLEDYFGKDKLPRFDLVLLGMGPDGHTASLFPGHPVLNETKLWVAPVTDSPKPPPNRITLTLPVLNNSNNTIFVVPGISKNVAIKKIFKDNESLPANMIKAPNWPFEGKVTFLVDENSASLIMDQDDIV